jgi:hypothetical protein
MLEVLPLENQSRVSVKAAIVLSTLLLALA